MRTIIAGSRACTDMHQLNAAVAACGWYPSVVISGTAKGADQLGEAWALANEIPVERFPADWDTHGNAAGPIRNEQMAACAEALIALWDGKSRGTKHMIDTAKRKGLHVHVQMIGGMRWLVAKDKFGKESRFANGDVSAVRSDCGRFTIGKNYLDGCSLYSLFDRDEAVKYDEDLCELKRLAEERARA